MRQRNVAATLGALLLLGFALLGRGSNAPAEGPPERGRELDRGVRASSPPLPRRETRPLETVRSLAAVEAAVAPGRPDSGTLRVHVVDDVGRPDPEAWAESVACPGFELASGLTGDGLPYRAFLGSCRLRAVRADGMLRTEGPPVDVRVTPDGVEVTLPIPSARSGGLQMAFRHEEEGLAILWMPDAAPLHQVGVREGDLIVAVDGEPVTDWDADTVREALTGPVGTSMVLEIRPGGIDTGSASVLVEVERARIDP